MIQLELFAEMALVIEQLEKHRGIDNFTAGTICNNVLLDIVGETYDVEASMVHDVVREVKSRLGLLDEEGGAR